MGNNSQLYWNASKSFVITDDTNLGVRTGLSTYSLQVEARIQLYRETILLLDVFPHEWLSLERYIKKINLTSLKKQIISTLEYEIKEKKEQHWSILEKYSNTY